ncbi:MAG: hypothetical protein WBA10_17220 [Elainellaceae cyanobacterium]
MSLFFDLLCAVNSPNQRASVDQLRAIADVLDLAAQHYGVTPAEVQTALSAIGPHLRAVLQQKVSIMQQPAELTVHQLAETETDDAIRTIVSPSVYGAMSSTIAAQTSLSDETAGEILSMLIPAAMHLLDLGAQYNVSNGNLLVSRFLNSDHKEDLDLGKVAYFIRRMMDVPAA